MNIPEVTILDGDGSHIWSGSMTAFARDNGRDVAREVIAQFRASLAVHGRLEPAFIGGGACPHFSVLM